MITGRQLLELLDQSQKHLADRLASCQKSQAQAQADRDYCLGQMRQAYDLIANTRIAEGAAPHHALAQVDDWVRVEVARRAQDYNALSGRILQATHQSSKLDENVSRQVFALEQAQSDYDRARARACSALSRHNSTFQALSARRLSAHRRVEDVENRLVESADRMVVFMASCRKDPLFSYCHDRKVGAADAAGNFLTRKLDQWAGKCCHYQQALRTLAVAHAEHVEWLANMRILQEEAAHASRLMEKMLDEYLLSSSDMVCVQIREGIALAVQNALHEKDAADYQLRSLMLSKRAFDRQEDAASQEIKRRLSIAIEAASSALLAELSLETQSPEDDRAAAMLVDLRQRLPGLEEALATCVANTSSLVRQREHIQSLRQALVARGLAGDHVGFEDDQSLRGMVLGLESGAVAPAHLLSTFISGSHPLAVCTSFPLSARGL